MVTLHNSIPSIICFPFSSFLQTEFQELILAGLQFYPRDYYDSLIMKFFSSFCYTSGVTKSLSQFSSLSRFHTFSLKS